MVIELATLKESTCYFSFLNPNGTCVEGNHVAHQFVESDVSVQLTGSCTAAMLPKHPNTVLQCCSFPFCIYTSNTFIVTDFNPEALSDLYGASQQGQKVAADRQEDQHAVKVQTCSWSSRPGQGMLQRHRREMRMRNEHHKIHFI